MQPLNTFVQPLLTDLYQITMAYAYWKNGHHEDHAVFDLFFRKNPFKGEFTVFAGLYEVLNFVENFKITEEDVRYLKEGCLTRKEDLKRRFEHDLELGIIRKTENGYERKDFFGNYSVVEYPADDRRVNPLMEKCEDEFFQWLTSIDCSKVKIHALKEGTLAFPKVPLIRVEGPLAIVQLLETTLLNLVNYPSLVATNAARFRIAAGKDKSLIEFGLRRAQGPDGAVSASRYCYMGGFDATSNVLAGKLLGVPVKGTHAHSFVSAFSSFDDLPSRALQDSNGKEVDFVEMVLETRKELGYKGTKDGELTAFIAYAQSFPEGFLALVDTYDTLTSGVPNFLAVAVTLVKLGYKPIGIRLDSGDLAYLSKQTRKLFLEAADKAGVSLDYLKIVASNDINEATLRALNQQEHDIDIFGIGTHLVTCQAQPSLGGVYKLVELNGKLRIKLSQEKTKMTIPAKKDVYRIIGKAGYPLLDLMTTGENDTPQKGEAVLCRHPFEAAKRVYAVPAEVISLQTCVWDGKRTYKEGSLEETRAYVLQQIESFRSDHLRQLNPTPYKIAISENLYKYMHDLWMHEAPIAEIS